MKRTMIILSLTAALSVATAHAFTTVPKSKMVLDETSEPNEHIDGRSLPELQDSSPILVGGETNSHVKPQKNPEDVSRNRLSASDQFAGVAQVGNSANLSDGIKSLLHATNTTTISDVEWSQVDLVGMGGQITPFDAPNHAPDNATVRVSSAIDGAAIVTNTWDDNGSDYWLHDNGQNEFLVVQRGLELTFRTDATGISLQYAVDGEWQNFEATSLPALSFVAFDSDGALLSGQTIAADETGAIKFLAGRPFKKLVLTPTSDKVWFASELKIDSGIDDTRLDRPDDYEQRLIKETQQSTSRTDFNSWTEVSASCMNETGCRSAIGNAETSSANDTCMNDGLCF